MNRFVMGSICFVGLFYLYRSSQKAAVGPIDREPPALTMAQTPPVPEEELKVIRQSTFDSDPNVRWAAVELLYTLRDPQARKILEHIMKTDTDQNVRNNAVNLLRNKEQKSTSAELLISFRDTEKQIRVAALQAVSEKDDLIFIPHIYQALLDSEPEVRLQALATLRIIQERKRRAYQELKEKLRADYERSVRNKR